MPKHTCRIERRTPLSLFLGFLFLPLLILAAAVVQPYLDPEQLFRDPLTAVMHVAPENCCEPYLGLISNLGVLLWHSAATVCIFMVFLMRDTKAERRYILFMFSSGLISIIFMIDDFFLAHEKIYPLLFGITEKSIMLSYVLLLFIYTLTFFKIILQVGALLFFLSMGLFALAVWIDIFYPTGGMMQRLGEDGTKFIAISTWTGFLFRSAWLLYLRSYGSDSKEHERTVRSSTHV
jgi:hypothetical protein